MKTILNYNEIIKRNEQLERENKQLRYEILMNLVEKNTIDYKYKYIIEELEKENKKLKQSNAYLKILTH